MDEAPLMAPTWLYHIYVTLSIGDTLRFTLDPSQNCVGPLMLTVGIPGFGYVVTVILFVELTEQPDVLNTVSE